MLPSLRVAIVSAIAFAAVATAAPVAAQTGTAPVGAAPPLPPRPQPPPAAPPVAPPPVATAAPQAPPPAGTPVPAPGPAGAPAPAPVPPPVTGQPPPPTVTTSPNGPPPPVYYTAPVQQPPPGYPPGPYAQPPAYPPPPAPESSRGAYRHDGFYLRMGLGVGRTAATFRNSDSREFGGSVEGSLAGVAAAVELSLGGTPAPGLVIGGGIFSGSTGAEVETNEVDVDGQPVPAVKYNQLTFTLIGPFVDYYFDERAGFHLQGALGLAAMEVGTGRQGSTELTANRTLGGLGFMLGGGYEWFVGEQWSLGGIIRMRYGALETDDDDDERYTFQTLALPEVLFSATFH